MYMKITKISNSDNIDKGILLKTKKHFLATTLEEVAGCLKYEGKAITIEEMEEAISQGIKGKEVLIISYKFDGKGLPEPDLCLMIK
jgi:hypothetical protein